MKTHPRRLCLIATVMFISGPVANGQEHQNKPAQPSVPAIQMQDVPLSITIENLARQAEINLTIDPKVSEQSPTPVTLRWENMTASNALVRLLKERGLFMVENPQTSVRKIMVTNSPPRVFDKELFNSSQELIPMIRMMDTPLKMALSDLGTKAGLKLELDAALLNPSRDQVFVSVRFDNLTGAQAVAAICDQHNLQITKSEQAGVWRVSRGK
jgi:hypothetical protein